MAGLLSSEGIWVGSEHLVEFSVSERRYVKTTIPSSFGLIPELRKLPLVDLRSAGTDQKFREVIEFVPATPLEYLDRWIAANEFFGDDVRLVSVIRWKDGAISLGITQPQYHGTPAEPREIGQHFLAAGWERLNDPSGHTIFYNFAFDVMPSISNAGTATSMAMTSCHLM